MPLFEFQCRTCGSFEEFISLESYESKVNCPSCKKNHSEFIVHQTFIRQALVSEKPKGLMKKTKNHPQ